MSNIATSTSSNIFYQARCKASTHNEQLRSRESAADYMMIDRGRLYRIESGLTNPYPEEVVLMADLYNAPELRNYYCTTACPLGKDLPKVDVQDLDAEFYVFSGHKIYGPTGIGVLYGKEEWLDKLPPYQGGGEMIASVSFEKTTFNELPFKFEAGTPDYIGSTALAEALRYVGRLGMDNIAAYEDELLRYATDKLNAIDGMRIFGQAAHKGAVLSFLVGNIHHYDMGMLLDRLGIAVRTGHHCAQPLMQDLGIEGTVRASFSFYNTKEEIDAFAAGIERVRKMF